MSVGPADVASLGIAELRSRRSTARRSLEVARLRARQDRAPQRVAELEHLVEQLTEELIARYRDDLTLVDSLLDATYPADGVGGGSR